MIWIAVLALQDPVVLEGDALKGSAKRVDVLFFGDLPAGDRGTLWSSWGDGLIASNGRYYTSIGDHRGTNATSRVYEVDPSARTVRLLIDVAKATGQKDGVYGHGKIHAALHEFDGAVWFSTYWGKPREIEWNETYQGSILLRWDLKGEKVENLGAVAPKRGLPASAFDAERGLVYFHAVAKDEDGSANELLVYDLKARKVKFRGGGEFLTGKRAFMRDLKGRAWVSMTGGALAVYDPEKNELEKTGVVLPESKGEARRGNELRAAARPAKSGIVYGMTGAGRLFAFDPEKRVVKDLGPNYESGDYTAVMVLSLDDKHLYFAPGAHGSGARIGTPVVRVDVATGERTVVCRLNEPLRASKYNIGGTYNLQIDADGGRLFATFNGAPLGGRKDETFGKPCVVIVHLAREGK